MILPLVHIETWWKWKTASDSLKKKHLLGGLERLIAFFYFSLNYRWSLFFFEEVHIDRSSISEKLATVVWPWIRSLSKAIHILFWGWNMNQSDKGSRLVLRLSLILLPDCFFHMEHWGEKEKLWALRLATATAEHGSPHHAWPSCCCSGWPPHTS